MEVFKTETLYNEQPSSVPGKKKTDKYKVISKPAFSALHKNVKGVFNATLSIEKGLG